LIQNATPVRNSRSLSQDNVATIAASVSGSGFPNRRGWPASAARLEPAGDTCLTWRAVFLGWRDPAQHVV